MVVTNILTQPYYLQIDSRWKDEIIGHSATRMSDAGCTVCCVSMAFTQLGTPIDPKTLNSDLTRRNGDTSAGLLKWNVAAEVSNNTLSFDLPDKPAYMTIDSAIQSGNPVIAKIALWESYPHWVLIVGKDGYEYLVKDPLCERQTIEKLSSVSKTIQSIRVVKRKYQ